jgi:hypothetical protein
VDPFEEAFQWEDSIIVDKSLLLIVGKYRWWWYAFAEFRKSDEHFKTERARWNLGVRRCSRNYLDRKVKLAYCNDIANVGEEDDVLLSKLFVILLPPLATRHLLQAFRVDPAFHQLMRPLRLHLRALTDPRWFLGMPSSEGRQSLVEKLLVDIFHLNLFILN